MKALHRRTSPYLPEARAGGVLEFKGLAPRNVLPHTHVQIHGNDKGHSARLIGTPDETAVSGES
eukprot:2304893-Amphidinium_carterae.2